MKYILGFLHIFVLGSCAGNCFKLIVVHIERLNGPIGILYERRLNEKRNIKALQNLNYKTFQTYVFLFIKVNFCQ